MHAQGQGTSHLATALAGRPRLLRVDQDLVPGEVSLDKVRRIDELVDHGRNAARKSAADVKERFLNSVQAERWNKAGGVKDH